MEHESMENGENIFDRMALEILLFKRLVEGFKLYSVNGSEILILEIRHEVFLPSIFLALLVRRIADFRG